MENLKKETNDSSRRELIFEEEIDTHTKIVGIISESKINKNICYHLYKITNGMKTHIPLKDVEWFYRHLLKVKSNYEEKMKIKEPFCSFE